MRPLRVLIASDGIAGLTSAEASEVIGRAFVAHDAQVAVIPMAVQGQQLNQAILRIHPDAEVVSCSGPADVLQHLGAPRTRAVFLDLSGMAEMDVDEVLGWVSPTQLRAFAELPHGAPLVAVVGEADASQPLTGMPGIIAERRPRLIHDHMMSATLDLDGEPLAQPPLYLDGFQAHVSHPIDACRC